LETTIHEKDKQTDHILTNYVDKFQEFKEKYMEELKTVLSINTSEKIAPMIEKYNDILQDKTKLILQELGIKNQENHTREVLVLMHQFQNTIRNELNTLLQHQINQTTMDGFLKSVDEKFSQTLCSSQHILSNLVSSSENRLLTQLSDIGSDNQKKMGELRDITMSNNVTQSQLHHNLTDFLRKLENSSSKGKISENLLYNVLQTIFPNAQIDYVGNTKESGDIVLTRKNKPVIMLENKNYDTNVGKSEIDKFIRDCEIQKCCGIMLSQKSGIVNQENFEIQLQGEQILLYLHHVEYNSDKIKTAIDIIDYFHETLVRLKINTNSEDVVFHKKELDEINKEYQVFVTNKLNHIKMIKETSTKMVQQVELLQFPNLELILNRVFTTNIVNKCENVCHICEFKAKNAKSLAIHLRTCEKKKMETTIIVDTIKLT
jgi:hypothetical protein